MAAFMAQSYLLEIYLNKHYLNVYIKRIDSISVLPIETIYFTSSVLVFSLLSEQLNNVYKNTLKITTNIAGQVHYKCFKFKGSFRYKMMK